MSSILYFTPSIRHQVIIPISKYNIVKEKPVLDISEKSESIGIDLNVKKRIVLL